MDNTSLKLVTIIAYALFPSSSGLYSEWSAWGPCSKSCDGEQNRTRLCQTITLQTCEGMTQTRNCNASGCYPSSEVIITSAVLGVLILLLLIILIVIYVKTRKTSRRITNIKNRDSVYDFEKTAATDLNHSHKSTNMKINKNNAQRTLSNTPSITSQVTYLQTDGPADHDKTAFEPWGEKNSDLY